MGKIFEKIFIIVVGGIILYLLQDKLSSYKSGSKSAPSMENQQTVNTQIKSLQNQPINAQEHKINTVEKANDKEVVPRNNLLTSKSLINSYALKVNEIDKRIINLEDGETKRVARQIFGSIEKLFINAESSGHLDSVTIILIDQLLIDLRKGRAIRKSLYVD